MLKRLFNLFKSEKRKVKDTIRQEKLEDKFYDLLYKIHIEEDRVKKHYMIKDCKKLAKRIPQLKNWPNGNIFWDIEAGMWKVNIQQGIRHKITKEITKLLKKDSYNLSLGSGSAPYVNSVLVDFSKEMLNLAPKKFTEKYNINLDKEKLPFKKNTFDSATMAFLTNYLENLNQLFKETYRVLKKNGKLIIINYDGFTSELYAEREKNHLLSKDLEKLLKKCKFKTKSYQKVIGKLKLNFIVCKK